jgi:hypothetical protein
MKAYAGVDVKIHVIFISAQVGDEYSVSHPGRFTPGLRVPSTHLIGDWVGPQNQSGRPEEEKNLAPAGTLNSHSSTVQSAANRYTGSWLLSHPLQSISH